MGRFGGKKILWGKSSSRHEDEDEEAYGKYVPLNVAIQETSSKGSLLERIASLEDRLVQMCLEIESYKRCCSSSMNTFCGSSTSSNINLSKIRRMSSYPTFGLKPQCTVQPKPSIEFQQRGTPGSTLKLQNKKPSSSMKQQQTLQGSKKDSKNGTKSKKNGTTPYWPHLRILGC